MSACDNCGSGERVRYVRSLGVRLCNACEHDSNERAAARRNARTAGPERRESGPSEPRQESALANTSDSLAPLTPAESAAAGAYKVRRERDLYRALAIMAGWQTP